MTSLQDKYDLIKSVVKQTSLEETELLHIVANLLLEETDNLLLQDKFLNNVSQDVDVNFTDYSSIESLSIFNKDSIAFQAAESAHKLLYLANLLHNQKTEHYKGK